MRKIGQTKEYVGEKSKIAKIKRWPSITRLSSLEKIKTLSNRWRFQQKFKNSARADDAKHTNKTKSQTKQGGTPSVVKTNNKMGRKVNNRADNSFRTLT